MLDNAWVRYADHELQLAAMGVDGRRREDVETWVNAVRELGVPSAMERAPFDPIWRDSLGFDPRDIDELLESRSVSGSVTIMRGEFSGVNPARWPGWATSRSRPMASPGTPSATSICSRPIT